MKKLILILLIILPFIGFAQFEAGEYINGDTAKIAGTSVIFPSDSIGQFHYEKMRDPSNPLDGVNLRTLFSRLASLDSLGLLVSDLVSGNQVINSGETQIYFPSAFDSNNVTVVPYVRRVSDDAVIDYSINDVDSNGFDVVVWEDNVKLSYVASNKISHSSDIFSEPIYSADSSYIKSSIRDFVSDSNYWNSKVSTEIDPKYTTDSSFIKSGVRDWNGSVAKTIDATDTTRWGSAIKGSGTASYIPIFTDSQTLGSSNIFQTLDGNVGIGTTNPTGKLTIQSLADAVALKIIGRSDDYSNLIFTNADGTNNSLIEGGNSKFNFYTYTGGSWNNRLSIDVASGNVGIGTTNPGTKLDVSGDINTTTLSTGKLTIQSLADAVALKIIGRSDDYSNLIFTNANGTNNSLIEGGNSKFNFYTYTGGSWNNRLSIDVASGNVGIGTTNPFSQLEVNSLTGNCIRTTYDDADGSAVNYVDYSVSSAGNATIMPSGGGLTVVGEITKGISSSKVPGVLFTQTASKTIANTTTETSLLSTGVGSLTLPANCLIAGKTIRCKLSGYISANNGVNTTINIKIGSVTLVSSTSAMPKALTGVGWEATFEFTCRTTGSTGTVIGQGGTLIYDGQAITTNYTRDLLMTSTSTVNTTVSNTLDITYTWGTADAGNSITCTNAIIEILN